MEGAFGLQSHRPLSRELFLDLLLHHLQVFGAAADDGLLGQVAAGNRAAMLLGDGLDDVERQREGTHLAFAVGAHQLAALLHEFQGAFETEHAGCNQRRVFAKTVARGDSGFQAVVGQLPEDLEAGHGVGQQCRLREPCEIELVLRVLEGKLRDVVTENFARLGVNTPGDGELLVKIAAHARVLGPLAREDVQDVVLVFGHCTNTPCSLK